MKYLFAIAAVVTGRRLVSHHRWSDPEYTPTGDDIWTYPSTADPAVPDTLPACPEGIPHPTTLMPDHTTHATKYPYVGATCVFQVSPGQFQIMPVAAFA